MNVTGRNLRIMRMALNFALSYIDNEIGQFPNTTEYAEDISSMREDYAVLFDMREHVSAAIDKEQHHES